MAQVLFVEPFYAGSHCAFLDGLVAHSSHDFTLPALPGEGWRRMQSAAHELDSRSGRDFPRTDSFTEMLKSLR